MEPYVSTGNESCADRDEKSRDSDVFIVPFIAVTDLVLGSVRAEQLAKAPGKATVDLAIGILDMDDPAPSEFETAPTSAE